MILKSLMKVILNFFWNNKWGKDVIFWKWFFVVIMIMYRGVFVIVVIGDIIFMKLFYCMKVKKKKIDGKDCMIFKWNIVIFVSEKCIVIDVKCSEDYFLVDVLCWCEVIG